MSLRNNEQTSNWSLFTYPILFFCLLFVINGCQKEAIRQFEEKVAPDQAIVEEAKQKAIAKFKQNRTISKLEFLERYPAKYEAFTATSRSKGTPDLMKVVSEMKAVKQHRALINRAINPEDFDCSGPTFIDDYINNLFADFTEEDFALGVYTLIPLFEALFFDFTDNDESFGINGEYTSTMQKTFIDLKTFWDIPTDILLLDMKGTIFQDVQRVAQVFQFAYFNIDEEGNPIPITTEEALEVAEFLKIVFGSDTWHNYNHPLFSFNAFAATDPDTGLPNKISMGDGLMEAYRATGYRTIAEKFILAHEYAHQIQYANGYIDFEAARTPEDTRRIELMADAYASYFMSHGKGPFLQPLMIKRFLKTAGSVGDCRFDNPGHHGTPNQRARAAELGGKLAARRGLRDPIYSSQEFFELFEEAFPSLIVPDAN